MDLKESVSSSGSDWEDVEDTKAETVKELDHEFLPLLCNTDPTDHTRNTELHADCDSSKKKPCSSRKQAIKKYKMRKSYKKGKFQKSTSKTNNVKSEKIDLNKLTLSRHYSLEAEALIQKCSQFSIDSYASKKNSQLSENPEKLPSSYFPESFSGNTTNRNNHHLNESCDKLSQSSSQFGYSYIRQDENSPNSQSISFNTDITRNACFESDSGSDSDTIKSIFSYKSLASRPVNNEKHYTKRSTSMFEYTKTKASCQIDKSASKNNISGPCNSTKINRQCNEEKLASGSMRPDFPPATEELVTADKKNENKDPQQFYQDIPSDIKIEKQFSEKELANDFVEISTGKKELFSKKQLSSDSIVSQFPSTTENFYIVNQENKNKSSHAFISNNQSVSTDKNIRLQYFGNKVDKDSVESSIKRKEFFCNNPLSPNSEMKPNNISHVIIKDDELTLNSLDFIDHCSQKLVDIAYENIDKILLKKEDLNSTYQRGNMSVQNVLMKRMHNLQQQQNQFDNIITQAKNQISYTVSQNYQDIVKTWDTIISSVQNECKLFENFFPAYACRNDIVQELNHKRILFLHSNNAYFFNILVPLILLKHYPSHFIVSCECDETQKQYLKYSLKSAMGSNEQKHKTYVMTESELLNYTLKKDYAIKKMTCFVLNLPLHRSVVSDILLSNLREMLNRNKNSKLVLIIDPNVDLTSYEKYFSMFEVSTIVPANLTYPVNTIWKNNTLVPEHDYVNEIVRTILSIHATNGWGNILTFVPSLRDARSVYQLLKKRCVDYQYNDLKIILVEENYYAICNAEIHEKNSRLKIVFISVGSAEMITLPFVHFIVDCGIVTDYHFDYDKKVDVLGTVFISTAKSKLRKTLGGIYGPGVCYRIYGKHNFINDMHSQDYPEVLLRNPLNSLVKILKYKLDVVLQKEFIEFLPEDVTTEAFRNLQKYGAIVDNKVSLIGEKLMKLPFEAKYSKLILLGIDFGLAFETVILVSFLTEKGKLFRSTDNSKYQRIIDAKQMELVQHQSDTLTNLHIYKTCLENKFDLEWCKKHYIDDNYLKKVHQRVNEMCEIVFLCLEIKISEHFSNDENWPMTIREIIFDCFQDNLCVFSGRLDCGFRVLSSKSVAYLPTQSIICHKDNVPQFLIFDHVQFSDKNYLVDVTSIPSDFVMKSLQDGSSYFTCEELFDNTLTGRIIEPVGEEVMNDVFLGEDEEKLKRVVEQIKLKTSSNLISIQPSVEKGCVCIYALPIYIDAAYQALKNILKVKFEEIINECQFHSYELVKDLKSVMLEVELAKGAMAKYVKIGIVLVQPLAESNVQGVGSVISAIKLSNTLPYSLHIAWIRRHCNGNAVVDFGESTNLNSVRRLSMRHIYLLGMEIFMEMSERKKNQLCISGLSPEICKEKLEDELKLLLPAAEITHIELMRILPFETCDKRLQAIESSISNICKNALNMNSTEIILSKPKPSDIVHEVFIKTSTTEGLDSVADLITIKFLEDKQSITTLMFNLRIICNNYIYKALQTQLNSTLSQLKEDLKSQDNVKTDFEINVDRGSEETYFINVSATNIAVLNLVHETINCLLNGEILNESDIKDLDKMFCHGGHVWLKGLEASENIYIIMNRQNKVLRLYGPQKNCENAKKRLIQYLKDIENDVNDIIELSSEKTKNFLLQALVQNYGIDLKKFIEECGLHQAYLDIRNAKLYVYGDQTSVEEASNCIQNLLETLDSVASETILSQETCPVCLCPAINLTYRLEHCGHLYHSEPCIHEFIEKNEDFPIKCSAEDCEKELVLKDIWKILRNNPERMKSLIKKSIANYLERHVLDIVLCPTPDCSMFFYKSEIGDKVNCGLCQNNICIKCHCVEHAGFTCEMYQETKKDADYSYKVWAKTANCKRCPRCATAIEKSEGCNHMTCRNCSGHFCWLCPSENAQVWATGNECYAHINRVHTGRLFDYN